MKKVIAISGASGYFGQIAIDFFAQQGYSVVRIGRNVEDDIFFDLNDPKSFSILKTEMKIDMFIHAAAAHEVTCRSEPYQSIFQNVAGTKAALEFCLLNNIKRFYYLSTFHVFGNPKGVITEETIPYPSNDYGMSHLQAEEYVQMYTRYHGIEGIILRPSNFYGAPKNLSQFKRWTLVPLAFCKSAIETGEIKLQTPGTQKRNFISINDICSAILNINEKQDLPLIVHLSGEDTISIYDFALLIKEILKDKFDIVVKISRPDFVNDESNEFIYGTNYDFNKKTNQNLQSFIISFCKELLNHV